MAAAVVVAEEDGNMNLLTIDIGNTNVSMGYLKNGKVVKVCHVSSTVSVEKLRVDLDKTLKKFRFANLVGVAICSVVPEVLKVVEARIKQQLGLKSIVVGRDIHVPIKNNYDYPQQVGQDRLVGAYAAKMLYGYPSIIIDLGTAITFDVVSKRGEYEGGMIVPGLRLSAETLFHKTALLPRIDRMKIPHQLIGKNTKESILSGLFNGYGAMCSGLIDLIKKRVKGRPKVIITGGHIELMNKFIAPKVDKLDKHLVLKGLNLMAFRCLKLS